MTRNWTTKEIELLKQLASEGKDRFEISKILDRDYSSVKSKAFALGLKVSNYSNFNGKIYAVYKKDKYITSGSIYEIAEYLKVNLKTVKFYLSNVHLKRSSEKAIRLIEI